MAYKNYDQFRRQQPETSGLKIGGNGEDDIVLTRGDIDSDVIAGAGGITVKDTEGGVIISGGSAAHESPYIKINSDGDEATADGVDGIAIGEGAEAAELQSIAIGHTADAAGINSISIGASSDALASDSIAIGNDANANHTGSIAMGKGAITTAANQLFIDDISSIVTPEFHHESQNRSIRIDSDGNWSLVAAGGQADNIAGNHLVSNPTWYQWHLQDADGDVVGGNIRMNAGNGLKLDSDNINDSEFTIEADTDILATVARLNDDEVTIQQIISGVFEIFDSDVQAAGNQEQTPAELNNEFYVTSQNVSGKTLYRVALDGPTIDTEAYDAIADHTTYLKVEVISAESGAAVEAGDEAIYKVYQEPTWTPDSEVLLIFTQNQKLLVDSGVDLLGRLANNNDTDFTADFSLYVQQAGAYHHIYDGTAGLVPGYTDTDNQQGSKALFGDAEWKKVITELPPRIYYEDDADAHHVITHIEKKTDEIILHTATNDITDTWNTIDVGSTQVEFGAAGNIATFPIDTDTEFVAVFKEGTITFTNDTAPTRSYDDLGNETVFVFPSTSYTVSGTVANGFHHDYSFVGTADADLTWVDKAYVDDIKNVTNFEVWHNVFDDGEWKYNPNAQLGPEGGDGNGQFYVGGALVSLGGDYHLILNDHDTDGTQISHADRSAITTKGTNFRLLRDDTDTVYYCRTTGGYFQAEGGVQSYMAVGFDVYHTDNDTTPAINHGWSEGENLSLELQQHASPPGLYVRSTDTDRAHIAYTAVYDTDDDTLTFEVAGADDVVVPLDGNRWLDINADSDTAKAVVSHDNSIAIGGGATTAADSEFVVKGVNRFRTPDWHDDTEVKMVAVDTDGVWSQTGLYMFHEDRKLKLAVSPVTYAAATQHVIDFRVNGIFTVNETTNFRIKDIDNSIVEQNVFYDSDLYLDIEDTRDATFDQLLSNPEIAAIVNLMKIGTDTIRFTWAAPGTVLPNQISFGGTGHTAEVPNIETTVTAGSYGGDAIYPPELAQINIGFGLVGTDSEFRVDDELFATRGYVNDNYFDTEQIFMYTDTDRLHLGEYVPYTDSDFLRIRFGTNATTSSGSYRIRIPDTDGNLVTSNVLSHTGTTTDSEHVQAVIDEINTNTAFSFATAAKVAPADTDRFSHEGIITYNIQKDIPADPPFERQHISGHTPFFPAEVITRGFASRNFVGKSYASTALGDGLTHQLSPNGIAIDTEWLDARIDDTTGTKITVESSDGASDTEIDFTPVFNEHNHIFVSITNAVFDYTNAKLKNILVDSAGNLFIHDNADSPVVTVGDIFGDELGQTQGVLRFGLSTNDSILEINIAATASIAATEHTDGERGWLIPADDWRYVSGDSVSGFPAIEDLKISRPGVAGLTLESLEEDWKSLFGADSDSDHILDGAAKPKFRWTFSDIIIGGEVGAAGTNAESQSYLTYVFEGTTYYRVFITGGESIRTNFNQATTEVVSKTY